MTTAEAKLKATSSVVLDGFTLSPLPHGKAALFFDAAATPLVGWRYLWRRRELWGYVILPILANLVVTIFVLGVLIVTATWIIGQAHPWFAEGWHDLLFWLGIVLEILFVLLVIAGSGVAAVLCWIILSGVLCGFFYGRLALAIEKRLGAKEGELREITLGEELIDTAQNVAWLVAFTLLWFVIGLVPIIGPPVAIAGSFYTSFFVAGMDYLAFPLALRGMRRKQRVRFCHAQRPSTLGLGGSVFVLQFLPVIGAVLLAGTAAGAVLLHRRMILDH